MESTTMPRVTVVIATYNRAKTLKYAIESVLWQTFQNFELWVIGDACTDNTSELMQTFLNDDRVHWYNMPKNSGYQSRPNNEGIRRAKGEYIAYLNHDDIWLSDHLQKLVDHMDRTNADIAFTIIQWVYSFTNSKPDIPLLPDLPIPPEATAVMHKKNIVDKIGYWKDIDQTYSYPRVDFFRQAQYAKLKFEIVPATTGLKFLWDEKHYSDVGPQPMYMERLRNEPDYLNKELSQMLIRAEAKLYKFPDFKRLIYMASIPLRKLLLRFKIDPARMLFWQKRGTKIQVWRKRHGLKSRVITGPATSKVDAQFLHSGH